MVAITVGGAIWMWQNGSVWVRNWTMSLPGTSVGLLPLVWMGLRTNATRFNWSPSANPSVTKVKACVWPGWIGTGSTDIGIPSWLATASDDGQTLSTTEPPAKATSLA